jgi:phosphatidylglycerophosphatase A
MKSVGRWAATALASGLYLSYLPAYLFRHWPLKGTGLIGSLWALAVLHWLPVKPLHTVAVLVAAFLLSVVISDYAEQAMGQKDDPRIVIDEFMGYWVAVAFLPRTLSVLMAGFVLFRLFDVFKLPWIRRAGELPGGWGVVIDDVLAGICANLLLHVAEIVHPF